MTLNKRLIVLLVVLMGMGWGLQRLGVGVDTPARCDTPSGVHYSCSGAITVTAGSTGITNSAGANVIPKSDGTNLVATSVTEVLDGSGDQKVVLSPTNSSYGSLYEFSDYYFDLEPGTGTVDDDGYDGGVHGGRAGGSNHNGGALGLYAGRGTGTGLGGNINFWYVPHGASGAAVNVGASAGSVNGDTGVWSFTKDLVLSNTSSPASNATCTAGTFTHDANFLYFCISSGVVKRAALTGGY